MTLDPDQTAHLHNRLQRCKSLTKIAHDAAIRPNRHMRKRIENATAECSALIEGMIAGLTYQVNREKAVKRVTPIDPPAVDEIQESPETAFDDIAIMVGVV